MFWVIWVVVAVVALVGEMLSLALVLASFGIAALLTAALSLLVPPVVQAVAFSILSVLLLFGVRPAVLPLLPIGGEGKASPRIGPIGRYATVIEQVDRARGQVRIGQGEFWSARTIEPDAIIAPNREVEIVEMQGLTALVRPIPSTPQALVLEGAAPFGLSAREVEVLQLVAQGLSNGDIAERLFLSPRTVHHHVSHILNKMGVDGRVDAVRLGIRQGIVTSDDVEP